MRRTVPTGPTGPNSSIRKMDRDASARQPVNFQEQTTYLEYAPLPYLSGFVEVPVRWLHIPPAISVVPEHHPGQLQPAQNFSGFSDLRLGFKYALVTDPGYFYTFQLRTYLPTGNGATGLGTAHATLEPGLLVYQRLTERTFFLGEFKDWIPLHGSTFSPGNTNEIRKHYAGNVLTYGAGFMYNLWVTDHYRAAPLVEFVGWTVLGGLKEVSPNLPPQSASGDTIVNVKVGAVFALGDYIDRDRLPPLSDRLNLYVGYGRALTGDWWYKDILRVNLTWYY